MEYLSHIYIFINIFINTFIVSIIIYDSYYISSLSNNQKNFKIPSTIMIIQ